MCIRDSGMGAAWNPKLVEEGFKVVGEQQKEMGVDFALVSMLDILRDPRSVSYTHLPAQQHAGRGFGKACCAFRDIDGRQEVDVYTCLLYTSRCV